MFFIILEKLFYILGLFYSVLQHLTFVFILMLYVLYSVYFTIKYLPEGTLIHSLPSPTKDYVLNVYGGKRENLNLNFVRAEVIFNTKKRKKAKNIYWQLNQSDINHIDWIDNDTVAIDNLKINIHKDHYDCRQIFQ